MYHFPIQLLERLPIQVRGLPLDSLLQVHCVLALLASPFTITPHYSLPLALALLISTSLSAHLLPHFLLLWLLSIPLDLMWLTYKASLARDVVVTLVGIGMILKVVTAGLVAEKCVDEGVVSGGSTGGSGGAEWASAGVSGGLSIPGGFWSGSGGGRGHDGEYVGDLVSKR